MTFQPPFGRLIAPPFGPALATASGITWLLRDDFTDTLAAGSVNGSAATPGPGTRVVVDTGTKLSVGSGFANISSHTAANDPLLVYSALAFTRAAGLMLYAKDLYTGSTASSTEFLFGLSSTSNGATLTSRLYRNTGTAIGYWDGGLRNVAVCAQNQHWGAALIARAAGYYMFLRSPSDSYLMLSWITATGTTSPVYVAYSNWSAGDNKAFTGIRVPDALWLPTPLASDGFSSATATDGLGHAETTGIGSGGAALAWTDRVGSWGLSGTTGICSATDGGVAIRTVTVGSADMIHTAALTRGTGTPGIVFRYLNALNFGYAVHNGTNAQLHKVVNGTDSTLVNAAGTYGHGRELRVICYGTKWRLYYNNALIGTEQTVSDADLLSGTGCGLYSTDTDSTFDNMVTYARGTGGEYATLDQYIA